jgi:ABC-2 type transport system permease protein
VKRIWLVLKREYLENVRTKAFLIGLVLTPVWMGLVFLVPALAKETSKSERVLIVDRTGVLGGPLSLELQKVRTKDDTPRFLPELLATPDASGMADLQLRAGRGDVFVLVLTPSLLENKREPAVGESGPALYGTSSVGAMDAGRALETAVNQVVNAQLVERNGVDPKVARALLTPAVRYTGLTAKGERGGAAQAVAPFMTMMLLFMGIVGISQMLISSTLEEKASRVYEVLLSSLSPFQLMSGKVLGICAVGFTLLALWSGGGLLAASMQGLSGLVTGGQVALFMAYYVLGFLLIASLMVSVGSACNTLKEAQNLMAPISLLLATPMLFALVVMRDPNGTLATALSFVPPFTPFLMMARISSVPSPPEWQIPASMALLALSTYVAIRLAARVFRVGILMYGQPPRLREILRWMRTP